MYYNESTNIYKFFSNSKESFMRDDNTKNFKSSKYNTFSLKRIFKNIYSIPFLILILLFLLFSSACSSPATSKSTNTNDNSESIVDNSTNDDYDESNDSEGNDNSDFDNNQSISKDGSYTQKDDVALYLHIYNTLPENFITKNEARQLGWSGGSLEPYAPGKCIGGDRFGNYEGLLPEDDNYKECDIDTLGKDSRGAKRIVFSDDGDIYYTENHYSSFEQLY